MGFFKILGGVALGVGAVAAAPFTGGGSILGAATLLGSLAGAGTIAAAVGAGAAGAAAGYALSNKDEEEKAADREDAKEAGKLIAKEEYEEKLREAEKGIVAWRNEFESVKKDTEQWQVYCKQLVAMFGVGLAVAYIDGHLAQEEKDEIDAFVMGASASNVPQQVAQAIMTLEKNPPSFEEAVQKAQEAGVQREVINAIIKAIAYADEILAPQEEQLLSDWRKGSYRIN